MLTRRLLLLAVFLFATTTLSANELRWRSLDVKANIDEDGTLHASERHVMIFDGDWNGGQRSISVRAGQRLIFARVARVASKKREVELKRVPGAPEAIDEYALFNNGTTIRWRARLAEDPPFHDKRLTYVIEYTQTKVLAKSTGPLRLDHDFAFAERPGPIEHYSLILELPPSLKQEPIRIAKDNIAPGQGVVVKEAYWPAKSSVAATPPAPVPAPKLAKPKKDPTHTTNPITSGGAQMIVVGLIVVALLFVFRFFFGEHAIGRFANVSADQLATNELLKIDAEVVGVAWDDKVGSDEVAAILARMTAEGKIESSTERGDLILKLKVPYESLRGYEADLTRALFLGNNETSTAAVRNHYELTGFDPARAISHNLRSALNGLPQWEDKPRSEWFVFWVLLVLTIGLAIAGGRQADVDAGMVIILLTLSVFGGVLTLLFTLGAKKALTGLWARFIFGLVVPLVSVWISAVIILHGPEIRIHHLSALTIASAALTLVVFATERMKTDQSREKVAFRKQLAATRAWLADATRGLAAPAPDAWIPYLYALDLTQEYVWHVAHVPPPPAPSPVRQYYAVPRSSSVADAAYAYQQEADRLRDERLQLERERDRMEHEASMFTRSFHASSPSFSSSSSSSSS
ncbi:MAG TPA: DUF2207 domain-containing protein, partial [Thermoanaerobaculia bacterium]|nr:DUF2207 domain-containing protein [Thermoanaerobaculia bacterium]